MQSHSCIVHYCCTWLEGSCPNLCWQYLRRLLRSTPEEVKATAGLEGMVPPGAHAKPVYTRHLALHTLPFFHLNSQIIKAICFNYSFFLKCSLVLIHLLENWKITIVFLTIFCFVLKTKGQDIFQRSILGHILPEAMVCYLENYEPEKFSEIFLGEFDTPEAIWSSEMR